MTVRPSRCHRTTCSSSKSRCRRIDRGEGFIEQNDRGILENEAREKRPLEFSD
jgi:hypothetical protein